jgi:hypothetical protein
MTVIISLEELQNFARDHSCEIVEFKNFKRKIDEEITEYVSITLELVK